MLKLEHVKPERWYTVREAVPILGWEVDSIRRFIREGYLEAQKRPGRIGRSRKRDFQAVRIQGCELIRFVKENLTVFRPEKRLRLRVAF